MKVRVGPHTYRIKFDTAELNRLAVDHGSAQGFDGYTDNDSTTIYVKEELGPSQRRDTILHELIHACNSFTGLDSELSEKVEERVARRLAPVLLDILRSNPTLLRYLTD